MPTGSDQEEIRCELQALVERYFRIDQASEASDQVRIPLSLPSYGVEEVMEALDSLLTKQVTMGKKVREFERRFAEYVGVRHATMVNSGSSANLLALSILTNPLLESCIRPGDEIITPAVTWATTVFPIIQVGALPVLVDVDRDTINVSPEQVERAITPRTRALMLVHLLGNPCAMEPLMELARAHNLFVIEDCCEAHGAEVHGRRVGSFGHLATFSFYFSHHITTIEGGMVLSNDIHLDELARALRVFGWVRELRNREELARNHAGIDPRYLFVNLGYNFRPTEIQGAFGMHQIRKLEEFIVARQATARYWTERLRPLERYFFLPAEREGTRHAWLFYPLLVRPDAPFTRDELAAFLESRRVETRPIMTGNIAEQPALRHFPYRAAGELPIARFIMRNGMLVGLHHSFRNRERDALVTYLEEFVSARAALLR
jgi:CDP-6-deoxy-D-xylo-4-hexulose-3-dehydrase